MGVGLNREQRSGRPLRGSRVRAECYPNSVAEGRRNSPPGLVVTVGALTMLSTRLHSPAVFGVVFSSPLCGRTMLRRPSVWSVMRPGEGCSRTAIGEVFLKLSGIWNNLANRGFAGNFRKTSPAVP